MFKRYNNKYDYGEKKTRSRYYVELLLAITEYNYFKPAAGVLVEKSNHTPSLIMREI